MDEYAQIVLTDDDGVETTFYVLESTKVAGVNYLLVTDCEDEDDSEEEASAYIMKDTSEPDSDEAVFEFVDDDEELKAVADIFVELLEDTDIEQ